MKLGVSVAPDKAALLPPGVVDFIEVNVQTFLVPMEDDAVFAPKLEAAAGCAFPIYAANGFLPGSLKSTGPEVDGGRIEAYAARAFERASRLGMKIIVFGSGGSRQVP
jgi:hypothetical protein